MTRRWITAITFFALLMLPALAGPLFAGAADGGAIERPPTPGPAFAPAVAATADAMPASAGTASPEDPSAACITCHGNETPVIVAQWKDSKHFGAGIGCLDCHAAEAGDIDGFVHEGVRIATIVTPRDCAQCHDTVADEFAASHHSKASQFIGSLDNVLGEVIEGRLAAVNGCWQCHGSTVALLLDERGQPKRDAAGKPMIDPSTWPNTGIGRVNLDGSSGTCTACHSRHAFSAAMARQPEVCGKCHMGPDHPQIEIYEESKHGIAFRTRIDEMNLKSDTWVLGKDYSAAPTCSTCHMSATPSQPVTHDVGARISWTLRPVVSRKLENWEKRRDAMKDTCHQCHSPGFVDAFYTTFDRTVEMWNNKFATPAQDLMTALRAKGRLTPTPFDEEIEWTFYRLWHHEGRRARMGASMMGPDYTQWHGFFEVAENFYFRFLPEVRELAGDDADLLAAIRKVEDMGEHAWLKGMSPEERQKIDAFYKERYGQPGGAR